jgi:hypothetical protein
VAPGHVLVDGDRVELYRPLPADPKDTRRRLAREGRTMRREGDAGGDGPATERGDPLAGPRR